MPDENGRLYLYEALELRAEYDHKIGLLEKLARPEHAKRGSWGTLDRDGPDLVPAPGFDLKASEETVARLRVRRMKLNEAIQVANFRAEIDLDGERISLARALELRKALKEELERHSSQTVEAAYTRVIHKEERDIVKEPPRRFEASYGDFESTLARLRRLVTALHRANHLVTVAFRDE
jgi:hypothetical protein